jgi:hypothetical protein
MNVLSTFIASIVSALMLLVFIVVGFVFVDRTLFADDPLLDFSPTTAEAPSSRGEQGQEGDSDPKRFAMKRDTVSRVAPVAVRRNDTAARYIQMLDYSRKSQQAAPAPTITGGYGVVILNQVEDQFLTQILPEIQALGQPSITISEQLGRTTVYGAQTVQEQKMIQQYLRDTYFLDTFLTASEPRGERG